MAVHPGVILRREIKKQYPTVSEFCSKSGIPHSTVSMIMIGNRGYGYTTAQRLERALGIKAEHWMYLLELYNKAHPPKVHPNIIRRQQRVLNAFKKL